MYKEFNISSSSFANYPKSETSSEKRRFVSSFPLTNIRFKFYNAINEFWQNSMTKDTYFKSSNTSFKSYLHCSILVYILY